MQDYTLRRRLRHRCLFRRRLLDDAGESFHWCPCLVVCGALTSDWYDCIRIRAASATGCASTGTCQSTLHSPSASVWAKTTKCASPARPRNIQLTAEAGPALRSFAWCGALVSPAPDSRQSTNLFTRIAEMVVLSCWRASSSASCTSLKATRARTKLASTSTQINPNWTSTCSMFKGATGQPVFNWQCGSFRCSAPGLTTALAPLARQHGCR